MIDREKVINALELEIKYGDTWQCALDCPYYGNTGGNCYTQVAIDALELLKAQKPKHGKWVRLTGMAPPEYHGHKICSLCNCFAPYDPIHPWKEILSKYCPGCGAKMEGEVDE